MAGQSLKLIDIAVIGGSFAGLTVAQTAVRALHSCIIFDKGKRRNYYNSPMRHLPTWDGKNPEEWIKSARDELGKYQDVSFVDNEVVKVQKREDGNFTVTDASGKHYDCRTLCFAIGVTEILPEIEGYQESYSKGIFPCMFQFGLEQKGASSAGLLAVDGLANTMFAKMLGQDGHKFCEKMTLYTNGDSDLASQLANSDLEPGTSVDDRRIKRLGRSLKDPIGVTIYFDDGDQAEESFLVHRPRTVMDRRLPEQLGLSVGAFDDIEVNPPFNQTALDGVYAAGDCSTRMRNIPAAISTGSFAGAGMARGLPRAITGNGFY